jgi:hypothetical protein
VSDEEAVFAVGDGGVLLPSGHARGPWDPDQLHGGAPAALVARAFERLDTPVPMRCARLAFEFAGVVPLRPLIVTAAITRPGRRLTLAEAVVRAGDVDVLRARATLLRTSAVALPAAPAEAAVAGPHDAAPARWTGAGAGQEAFHLTAMELRFARGDWGPGPALAWFRLRRPIVAGEVTTPLQRAVACADFGNGVSRALDFAQYLFINTDLTVHLHREPRGAWVALDARTDLDGAGVGQATSVLHDEAGRIGVAAQSLFVDAR